MSAVLVQIMTYISVKTRIIWLVILLSLSLLFYSVNSLIGHVYLLNLQSQVKSIETTPVRNIVAFGHPLGPYIERVLIWDGERPSTQAYIARLIQWLGQFDEVSHFNVDVLALINQAIEKRPTKANQYLIKAMVLWKNGHSKKHIAEQYRYAYEYGPYERDVTLAIFTFYVAFWEQLTIGELRQFNRYVVTSKDYRIHPYHFGRIIKRSSNKHQICAFLKSELIVIDAC